MIKSTNKTLKTFLTVICSILIVISLAGCVYDIISQNLTYTIMAVLIIAAIACGIHYIFEGYKKENFEYLRIFLLICAFVLFFTIVSTIYMMNVTGLTYAIVMGLSILSFGSFLILGIGKDLGKLFSYILSIYNVAFWLTLLIIRIINKAFADVGIVLGLFTLSTLAFCMIIAKYIDKKERKSNN